jgi:hypothetical protein
MRKSTYVIMILVVLALAVVAVTKLMDDGTTTGYAPVERHDREVGPSKGKATVSIPEHAIEMVPGVFFLGTAIEQGKLVEGYAIVDYKKGHAKPGTECGNGICEPSENVNKCPADCSGGEVPTDTTCYGFFAKSLRWRTVEPWVMNPANIRGLDETQLFLHFANDILTWETEAGTDILGDGVMTTDALEADMTEPDDQNEVYFDDIEEPGVIAMTVVWGIFRGPPASRNIISWDHVYDDVNYDWSNEAEGVPLKMDFDNIVTHELGHSIGLLDMYDSACLDVTMYGRAGYEETNKRSLEAADITGVKELYK